MIITTEKQSFLSAWKYRNYRFLWGCTLGVYIKHWIEAVVISWLVLELTDSPFLVGLLAACRFMAMFFGPFCGTISDRYDRRHILIVVQFALAVASLIMMGIALASRLEVWHLFVFTLIGSIGFTLNFSTLYPTASDMVKSSHLVSAISLLMAATSATSIFGPLLGGSSLGIFGISGCFALMAACSLGSFFMALSIKVTFSATAKNTDSVWRNLVAGLRYIKNDKALLSLIFLAALANLLILPYRYTLIPLFARDIFNIGARGFGELLAAVGLGVTLGSLATGALPRSLNKGRLLIVISFIWPILLMILAPIRLLPLSILLLIVAGVAQGVSITLIQSLLLIWSSPEMHGRVSGARAFAISTLPFGNLIAGTGATFWGAPSALFVISAIAILITAIITIWATQLRRSHFKTPSEA